MRIFGARGQDARGVDIKSSSFTHCVGSITDRGVVRRCVAGMRTVIHAATLHKPHVATHSYQDFLDINVTGTLVLLEEAVKAGVESFVFTSTTSAFGAALTPAKGEPAAWVTEDVLPIPKNIYGASKVAAEGLCELFARQHRLPTIVLRTSRFFPEADDDAAIRDVYEPANAQANELLNRRADIADVVDAHILAAERARAIGFGRYIISATTPFGEGDLQALRHDAAGVVHGLFPDCHALYARRGWRLFPAIDRVYVNWRALTELGWRPRYDFRNMLESLAQGADFRSPLAREVGSKGYHDEVFAGAPYPVA